jgi:hypothetical protein
MADSKILQEMTNSKKKKKKKIMTLRGPTQNYASYLFSGTTITPCSSDIFSFWSLFMTIIYYVKNNKNINSTTYY